MGLRWYALLYMVMKELCAYYLIYTRQWIGCLLNILFEDSYDILKLLLNSEAGKKLDGIPLMHAAAHGHEGIVRLLLSHFSSTSNVFRSPFICAFRHGRIGIAQRILGTGNVRAYDIEETFKYYREVDPFFPLYKVAYGARIELDPNYKATALICAAYARDKELVQEILDRGVSAYALGAAGKTALECAATNDDTDNVRQLLLDDEHIKEFLLEENENTNEHFNEIAEAAIRGLVNGSKSEAGSLFTTFFL